MGQPPQYPKSCIRYSSHPLGITTICLPTLSLGLIVTAFVTRGTYYTDRRLPNPSHDHDRIPSSNNDRNSNPTPQAGHLPVTVTRSTEGVPLSRVGKRRGWLGLGLTLIGALGLLASPLHDGSCYGISWMRPAWCTHEHPKTKWMLNHD